MLRSWAVAPLLAMSFVLGPAMIALGQKGEVATWVDNTGKHKVQAEFVRLDGTNVVLLKGDGSEVKIPMSKLSSESQARARDAAKAMAKAPPRREPGETKPTSSSSSGLDSIQVPPVVAFPSNATAQQFADVLVEEMKKTNMIVMWDAMPSRYQKDIEELASTAATKLDPATFRAVRVTSESLVKVFKTKKEFILGSQRLKELLGSQDISQSYDPGVELLAAYLAPEILTPDRLKKGNLRDLLGKYIVNITQKSLALEKTLPEGVAKKSIQSQLPPDFKCQVEQNGSEKASVTITADGKTVPMTFVNVDGHWLPEQMAQGWDQNISMAKQQLQAITPEQATMIGQQLTGAIAAFVTPQILQLQSAKTQAEFDERIGTLIDMAQKNMPPLPGQN